MLGLRDIVWSLLLCGVLTFYFDCRPSMQAQAFVEQQAEEAFLEAYAGHRWAATNDIITPKGAGGAHDRGAVVRVQKRRLDVKAQRMSWSGEKGELVVRHVLVLQDGSPAGDDASQDIHLRIEKDRGRWRYTLFEVRGLGAVDTAGNPFLNALQASRAATAG